MANDRNKKKASAQAPPTPEATPQPSVAEGQIRKVLASTSDDDILQVTSESSEDEIAENFIRIGCDLHPAYNHTKGSKEAYDKVLKAGKAKDVEEKWHSALEHWDGQTDLWEDDVDNGSESDGPPDADDIDEMMEAPTEWAEKFFNDVDHLVEKLKKEPMSKDLRKEIENANERLGQENAEHGLPGTNWNIPVSNLSPLYDYLLKSYQKLDEGEGNEDTESNCQQTQEMIEDILARLKLPKRWAMHPYKAPASTDGDPEPDSEVHIQYPWHVEETEDGSTILGYRKRGSGHQLTVRLPNGKYVVQSASEFGLREAAKYRSKPNANKISDGQADWTFKQRDDFEELLWTAVAPIKIRTSEGRAAAADCCVRFKTAGIKILTRSSLQKVLGRGDCQKEIKKSCERQNQPSPWDVEPSFVMASTSKSSPKKADGKPNAKKTALRPSDANAESDSDRISHLEQQLSKALALLQTLTQSQTSE